MIRMYCILIDTYPYIYTYAYTNIHVCIYTFIEIVYTNIVHASFIRTLVMLILAGSMYFKNAYKVDFVTQCLVVMMMST
jgi:hypothetical protein